jgi:ArsR family transcriptional regulator, cadmium/lead-responsive transcriptional repressor
MPSVMTPTPAITTARARLFRVLGDPTRLAILDRLEQRPHTVSELVDALEVPQSRVSTHLACLRWCQLVDNERDGRKVTYSLRDPRVGAVLAAGQELALERRDHLASCRRIGPDWM